MNRIIRELDGSKKNLKIGQHKKSLRPALDQPIESQPALVCFFKVASKKYSGVTVSSLV